MILGPTLTMKRYMATSEMVGHGVAMSGQSAVFGSEIKTEQFGTTSKL